MLYTQEEMQKSVNDFVCKMSKQVATFALEQIENSVRDALNDNVKALKEASTNTNDEFYADGYETALKSCLECIREYKNDFKNINISRKDKNGKTK